MENSTCKPIWKNKVGHAWLLLSHRRTSTPLLNNDAATLYSPFPHKCNITLSSEPHRFHRAETHTG
jgi:hypothetical protein